MLICLQQSLEIEKQERSFIKLSPNKFDLLGVELPALFFILTICKLYILFYIDLDQYILQSSENISKFPMILFLKCDNTNTPRKNYDYTTIADRLGTVS